MLNFENFAELLKPPEYESSSLEEYSEEKLKSQASRGKANKRRVSKLRTKKTKKKTTTKEKTSTKNKESKNKSVETRLNPRRIVVPSMEKNLIFDSGWVYGMSKTKQIKSRSEVKGNVALASINKERNVTNEGHRQTKMKNAEVFYSIEIRHAMEDFKSKRDSFLKSLKKLETLITAVDFPISHSQSLSSGQEMDEEGDGLKKKTIRSVSDHFRKESDREKSSSPTDTPTEMSIASRKFTQDGQDPDVVKSNEKVLRYLKSQIACSTESDAAEDRERTNAKPEKMNFELYQLKKNLRSLYKTEKPLGDGVRNTNRAASGTDSPVKISATDSMKNLLPPCSVFPGME